MSKAKKPKNIKYYVVTNTELEIFIQQVNQLLNHGYTPAGGVSTTTSIRQQSQVVYSQALILEE